MSLRTGLSQVRGEESPDLMTRPQSSAMALHPQVWLTEGHPYSFYSRRSLPASQPQQIAFLKCYHCRASQLHVAPGATGSMRGVASSIFVFFGS